MSSPSHTHAVGRPRFLASVYAMLWLWSPAHAADDPRAPNPAGGGASLVLEPVLINVAPRRRRLVYASRNDDVIEFSDRPCAVDFSTHTVTFAPSPAAGSAPSTLARAASAATRPKDLAPQPRSSSISRSVAASSGSRCDSLRAQIDSIDSRMREGYSAREAARLWNRWRELKEKLRQGRC